MHLVKLVVLGATGTGKSSIIQQFLESTFIESRGPTILNPIDNSYSFTIIMNGCVYQLKIIDMPMINYFPTNSFYEWTDYRGCALRSAHGYLLIFDLTSPGSFQYVKVIRDQLSESRNMSNIPIYVVGNKADLCSSVLNNMRSSHSHHSSHSRYSLYPLTYPRFSGLTLSSFSSSHHHSSWLSTRTHRNTHFNSSSAQQQQQQNQTQQSQQPIQQQQTQASSSSHHQSASHHHHHHHHRLHFHHHHHHWDDLTPAFKELANLVKKQWKCNYLECSAKYNWRIVPIFRDILRLIEINQSKCLDHSVNYNNNYIDGDLDYHRDSIKFSLTSTTLNQPNTTTNNQLVTTTTTTTSTATINPIVTINTLTPTINDRTSTINDSNNTNHQSCIIL